jgi:hypothetical protein
MGLPKNEVDTWEYPYIFPWVKPSRDPVEAETNVTRGLE